MAFTWKNSKGITYYLHQRKTGRGDGTIFFFSRNKESRYALDEIPDRFEVVENETTCLPMLRMKGTAGI